MNIKIYTPAKYTHVTFLFSLLISIIYSMYMDRICTSNYHLKYSIFLLHSKVPLCSFMSLIL